MNRKEFAKGFGWNALLNAVNKILFAVVGIVIARILGPAQFGIFSAVSMIFALSDIFRDAGLGATYIAHRDVDEKTESDYVLLSVVSGVVLGVLLFAARHPIADFFPDFAGLDQALIFVALALAINGFGTIAVAKLQKQARFKAAGMIEILATAASYAVALTLVLLGVGFMALVYQLVIRVGLYVLFSYVASRPERPSKDFGAALKLFRRALAVLGSNILFSLYTMADNLLIGKLFGGAALGFYAAAYNFAVKPLDFVTWPLQRTLFVAYTKHSGDSEKLGSIFAKSIAAASLFSFPIFLLLMAFADPILPLLYGDDFAPAVPLLQLLSIYLLARSVGSLAGSALVATGRAKLNVLCALLAFLVAGGGMWLTRRTLDVTSATGWITAGALAFYIANLAFAFKHLRPSPNETVNLFKVLVLTTVTAALIFGMSALPVEPLGKTILAMLLVPVVHLLLIGTVFAGNPVACLSISGIRKLTKV